MVTATEDYNYMGKHKFMIFPRVFCESPHDFFESDRSRYKEEYYSISSDGTEGIEISTGGYENCLDITKNGIFHIQYNGNRFNGGY